VTLSRECRQLEHPPHSHDLNRRHYLKYARSTTSRHLETGEPEPISGSCIGTANREPCLPVKGAGVFDIEVFAIHVEPPTADDFALIVRCVRRRWNGGSCYAKDMSARGAGL